MIGHTLDNVEVVPLHLNYLNHVGPPEWSIILTKWRVLTLWVIPAREPFSPAESLVLDVVLQQLDAVGKAVHEVRVDGRVPHERPPVH